MTDGPISPAGRALADFYGYPIGFAIIIAIVFPSFLKGIAFAAIAGGVFGFVTALRSHGAWREFGEDIPLVAFFGVWVIKGILAVAGWSAVALGIGFVVRLAFR